MTENIQFFQINLNKCHDAQAKLMVDLTKLEVQQYICLIQEPHFGWLKPSSIHRQSMQVFHGKGCKKLWPRAMIVASKNLKISVIEELTSRDTTCINLHSSDKEIMICSSYQDINFTELINIDQCVEKAKATSKELIIGTDSNSHSQLWFSNSTNPRGEVFEEFICQNNLLLCNVGNKPTYDCSIGRSIIDITLVTSQISDRIQSWTVQDENYGSDHKLITFTLNSNSIQTAKFRNYKKANWKYFHTSLAKQKWENPPEYWCKETIDSEVEKLDQDITLALDKVCPEKEHKFKSKTQPWWNTNLHNLKIKEKRAYDKWDSTRIGNDLEGATDKHEAYKKSRKEFKRAVRKSKRTSWQKFTSECNDIYLLNKIVHKGQQNSISMMEGCDTALDSNKVLMDTHFPGSVPVEDPPLSAANQADPDTADTETDNRNASSNDCIKISNKDLNDLNFLDTPRVKEAFKDMKALNSGGPDGKKSIVFQNLPNNMLYRISRIYKASVKLKYTPSKWCEADVIFLPKQDKPCYNQPKSFRPISKFNVLLKGLEKLVKWELEKTSLVENPLHKDQHAYSRVKNCNTALTRVVDQIEKGLLRKEFTLGLFIDISGAFNNLITEKALQAMRDRGFPEHLVSWYESFVTNRVANSELLGSKVKRKLKLGTPQGGVLSPLCWNVPMDELLELLNKIDGVTAPGFSDDLSMLATGKDETRLSEILEEALKVAKAWLEKYGLSISPTKSVAVMFTNKQDKNWKKRPITFEGQEIPFKKEVKYLGVILDSKLLWTSHVNHKLGKAKRHLMAFHRAISKKYGPCPILMKRAYTTIVVPAFTYGCHVFGDRCQQISVQKALNRLNRLASLLIASVSPSTPTKGLEIIYHQMPMHILIEQKASETMARINDQIHPNWDGLGHNKRNGHIQRWRAQAPKITKNTIKTDRIPTEIVKERNFKVHSIDNGRTSRKEATGIASYTDGSVLDSKTGCGVHTVLGKRVIYNGHFYLGDSPTVFQAEVTALRISAEKLIRDGWEDQTITFYSDSQASLAALDKLTVKSDTVKKCLSTLNHLGKKNKVHLRWVKAHVGIPGNEVADSLAKKGTAIGGNPAIELLTPSVKQKEAIKSYFLKKWSKDWKSYNAARQTKIWFPEPDSKKSQELLKRSRSNLSRLVQFLTGHNMLKRHRNIQKGIDDPESCRLCLEEEESSFHVIAECNAMQSYRTEIFHTLNNLPNPPVWTIQQVEDFLKKSPVGNMLDEHP